MLCAEEVVEPAAPGVDAEEDVDQAAERAGRPGRGAELTTGHRGREPSSRPTDPRPAHAEQRVDGAGRGADIVRRVKT